MNGTKIVGYLMIAAAVIKVAIDLLNGGSFDVQANWDEIVVALAGAGIIRGRTAISKAAKGQS